MLKPIGSLTADDVTSLITNKVPEGRSLEYKEELPGGSSSQKKEFFADISSLANTVGGWILYGVAEERDEEGRPTGVPRECVGLKDNSERQVLRCDSMARDGIEPRIPGFRCRAIPLSDSAFVLACWVPKSLQAPHMVVFEGASKFYARGASGKYPLDVQQIREAFVGSESLRDKIRAFRLDRIASIAAGNPGRVTRGALRRPPRHPAQHVRQRDGAAAGGILQDGLFGFLRLRSRYNFDGLVGYREGRDAAYDYVQIFRNGAVEFVRPLGPTGTKRKVIPSLLIERELAQQLEVNLRSLEGCGVEGPLLVTLTCIGVKGWRMALPQGRDFVDETAPIDRDTLTLPDVWLEQVPAPLDFQASAKILRGPFDALWQSSGRDGSPYFNFDEALGVGSSAWTPGRFSSPVAAVIMHGPGRPNS